jgi:Eukaryotic translation initiation factor 3 subunit 7 (eIF-3)
VLLPGEKFTCPEPSPFTSEPSAPLPSVAYKYRKWVLDRDSEVALVVRCELDGVLNNKNQDQLLSIKALNEFDPRVTGALVASLKPIGRARSHLACRVGHVVPIWQPCVGTSFQ